jgi:threonylcarbamoyladenosine tRNA methylthiotransferase MtaB
MKVFLDMVGCRLNQSEIEAYAIQLRQAGHTLCSSPEFADLVIVNTCTVTAAAASDSRHKIRQVARAGAQQIIVTGCHATLNPAEISALPGVTQVIDNSLKDDLVPITLNLSSLEIEHTDINRDPIPGTRLRTRAFIKVQDGCDNYCTYCITRLARGTGRSRSIPDILEDIQAALRGGAKEVVLTGVHLGSWGFDFAQPDDIKTLVRAILADTDTPRLHLSSIEPWDISTGFFELWQNPRVCRHLHLPLQSGCGATLKRMGRKIDPSTFAKLVCKARQAIRGVAITTDIITGFPGETEGEFDESCRFVTDMSFANGHVFTFSPRPGTAAALMPEQVPYPMAKQRNALMHQIFQQAANDFLREHVGSDLPVLWEKAVPLKGGQWLMSGLSDNYLRVHTVSSTLLQNQISIVHITRVENGELLCDILPG